MCGRIDAARNVVTLPLFSGVRVCSFITATYGTLFAVTPFQLPLYFLLDNRVCNTPYCKCEQGVGNTPNAELLLSYIPWKWERVCKHHSRRSSFQIIKGEETNLRLNNTNKFSPAERSQDKSISCARPARLLTRRQRQ